MYIRSEVRYLNTTYMIVETKMLLPHVFFLVAISVGEVASDETTAATSTLTATASILTTGTISLNTTEPKTTSRYEETTYRTTAKGTEVSATTTRSYGDCGKPGVPPNLPPLPFTNLVVNGEEAVPHSWPWQVLLQFRDHVDLNLWRKSCGGSILTPYDIVTAAHCFVRERKKVPPGWFANPKNWRVVIGAHNISQYATDYTTAYVVDIDIHESYRMDDKHYPHFDIAIVTLSNPIEFSIYASAVCLAKTDLRPNTFCYVSGWGLNNITTENGTSPEVLFQAGVQILRSDICRHYYRVALDETMVCAGNRAEGPDTCQGDSGGPLVCQNSDNVWELVGITSYGHSCGIQPGVYTRVPHFVDWINERTKRRYK